VWTLVLASAVLLFPFFLLAVGYTFGPKVVRAKEDTDYLDDVKDQVAVLNHSCGGEDTVRLSSLRRAWLDKIKREKVSVL
jgi:hypothetical protein